MKRYSRRSVIFASLLLTIAHGYSCKEALARLAEARNEIAAQAVKIERLESSTFEESNDDFFSFANALDTTIDVWWSEDGSERAYLFSIDPYDARTATRPEGTHHFFEAILSADESDNNERTPIDSVWPGDYAEQGYYIFGLELVTSATINGGCRDSSAHEAAEQCSYWRSLGHCDATSPYFSFMRDHCQLTCELCTVANKHQSPPIQLPGGVKLPDHCQRPVEAVPALDPAASESKDGLWSVNAVFEALTNNASMVRTLGIEVHSRDPWIITFEHFVSASEADDLTATCAALQEDFPRTSSGAKLGAVSESGWERSVDAGDLLPDGTFRAVESSGRTSMTCWCDERCVGMIDDENDVGAHPESRRNRGHEEQDETHDNRRVGFEGYRKREDLSSAQGHWQFMAARRTLERVSAVTRAPVSHTENLQFLRYERGQYYREHHDFIEGHVDMPCGPRTFTILIYLSDVEKGGGTRFSRVKKIKEPMVAQDSSEVVVNDISQVQADEFEEPDSQSRAQPRAQLGRSKERRAEVDDREIIVLPKKGRAVMWPSVLDEDPTRCDERTQHEALPVVQGVKYAANAWVHLYDFMAPNAAGCTG